MRADRFFYLDQKLKNPEQLPNDMPEPNSALHVESRIMKTSLA